MNKIRVLIVDDHPMFREALRAAIEAEEDFVVVAEAGDGILALKAVRDSQPDVIVMDLNLPRRNGIEAITDIIAEFPQSRILAITSSLDEGNALAVVQAGALGYILKDASRELFLKALSQVAQGNVYLPEAMSAKIIQGLRQQSLLTPKEKPLHLSLTPRELEILTLIGEGLSNQAIAKQLFLSESTVRVHVYNLLDKLKLEERNQAIVYALRHLKTE